VFLSNRMISFITRSRQTLFGIMANRNIIYNGNYVCLVTHDDCDDVMKIDTNIYNGADTLPFCYHEIVDDPLSNPYLAVLD